MTAHARLSPSNHRWPNCPGSVREEAKYPNISGDAAIDGTGSHILLELCLTNNVPAINYDRQIIGANHQERPMGWLVDQDRCNRVQICLDYVVRRKKELKELFPGSHVFIHSESKSDPGYFFKRNDWYGTCDITIEVVDPAKGILFIEVIDYKDGQGWVSEKFNSQLISYLYGKVMHYVVLDNLKGVRMTIVQPKTSTPIRYQCSMNPDHNFSIETMHQEAKKLADAAALTDDPNAPLIPGKHCTWCNHNPKRGGTCTAATDKSVEVINTMNTKEEGLIEYISKAVSDVKSLPVEILVKIADAKDGFKAAFDKVDAEIQERIETGQSVPGYAMLPGKSSRVWSESEEIVVKKLKAKRLKMDQIYNSTLITPAAVMKLSELTDAQKKTIEEELITTVAGKLTLKKVSYDHKEPKDINTMFMGIDSKSDETVSFF